MNPGIRLNGAIIQTFKINLRIMNRNPSSTTFLSFDTSFDIFQPFSLTETLTWYFVLTGHLFLLCMKTNCLSKAVWAYLNRLPNSSEFSKNENGRYFLSFQWTAAGFPDLLFLGDFLFSFFASVYRVLQFVAHASCTWDIATRVSSSGSAHALMWLTDQLALNTSPYLPTLIMPLGYKHN